MLSYNSAVISLEVLTLIQPVDPSVKQRCMPPYIKKKIIYLKNIYNEFKK